MRKTPSYLKGLAETRARAAGDVERLGRLHATVSASLETAQAELAACDRLIQKFDARLDPRRIKPIHVHGRCGARGVLKRAICEYLRGHASQEVSTFEIALYLQEHFSLDFQLASQREVWVHGTVVKQVKRLMNEGLVERLHSPKANRGGRWRWIGEPTDALAALRQLAQAAGLDVNRGTSQSKVNPGQGDAP